MEPQHLLSFDLAQVSILDDYERARTDQCSPRSISEEYDDWVQVSDDEDDDDACLRLTESFECPTLNASTDTAELEFEDAGFLLVDPADGPEEKEIKDWLLIERQLEIQLYEQRKISGVKQNTDHYAVLGLAKADCPSENDIRLAYLRLAKLYHPDKNHGDPLAQLKFKEISTSYQVLSSKDLREAYDKYGVSCASPSDYSTPQELFQKMFGGGKFASVFGEIDPSKNVSPPVVTKSFKKAGLTNKSGTFAASQAASSKSAPARATTFVEEYELKIAQLASSLLEKLECYVSGNVGTFVDEIQHEAGLLSSGTGGPELLQMIGYVYVQEANQHQRCFLGLKNIWCQLEEKTHYFTETVKTISQALKAHVEQVNLERNKTPTFADTTQGLLAIWQMGKLQAEQIVRSVCEMVMEDDVEEAIKDRRIAGIKLMGEMYKNIGFSTERKNNEKLL